MTAIRALLWKEWRSLRGIRWAGMALGAVLPVAFAIGAERVPRGGGIFSAQASWTPQVILMEVLPASLALAIWPLVALLAAAQAFAADRAAGTESFLLERPVSRRRVFLARLTMTYGSLAVVVAGTALLTLAIARVAAAPDAEASRRALGIMAAGAAGAAIVVLCGVGASGVVKSPMVAVLAGMFLLGLPLLLATELAGRFPAARLGMIRLGLVWPWLLLPTYLLAGWAGATRGEPLGRGSARRVGAVLAVGLAVVVIGFLASGAWATRYEASRGGWNVDVEMPSAGRSIVIRTAGGYQDEAGWIVDTASGKRLRFLPPSHAFAPGWNRDGSTLALVTDAGRFGAIDDLVRMEFYRQDGTPSRDAIPLPGITWVDTVAWCGERVAMTASTEGREAELLFVDPRSGAVERSAFRRPLLRMFGPTEDGALWLRVYRRASGSDGGTIAPAPAEAKAIELYRVDPATRTVTAAPVVVEERWLSFGFEGRLSRSGRYWVAERGDDRGVASRSIVEIATGAVAAEPRPTRNLFWLADDRIAWTETAGDTTVLMLAEVGEPGRPLEAWKNAHASLMPTPGGGALVASIVEREAAGPKERSWGLGEDEVGSLPPMPGFGPVPSHRAYVVAEDRWIDVSHVFGRSGPEWPRYRPAGPNLVLRTGLGQAELVSIDRSGEIVRVW